MSLNKYSLATTLFLWVLIPSFSQAHIVAILQYDSAELPTLGLYCDDHWRGTKEANLKQLKTFVEKTLTREPIHLVIETKFFQGIDCDKTKASESLQNLRDTFTYPDEVWTFDNSPQSPDATTWISWELPLILMSIKNDEELPPFIELNHEQREHIKENVSAVFIDSRIKLHPSFRNRMKPDDVAKGLEIRLYALLDSLPNTSALDSLKENIGNSVSQLTKELDVASDYDLIFDIEMVMAIVESCVVRKEGKAKVFGLCGGRHAKFLLTILPSIGFITPPLAFVSVSSSV